MAKRFRSSRRPMRGAMGLPTIFQELMIVPEMSVAENIVLGDEPGVGPMRQIYSRRRAQCVCDDILDSLGQGSAIRADQLAGSLSTGHKQIVEIARALIQHAPVIILDEPTAALSDNEADVLLRILAGSVRKVLPSCSYHIGWRRFVALQIALPCFAAAAKLQPCIVPN